MMKRVLGICTGVLLAVVLASTTALAQQEQKPKVVLSPPASTDCTLGNGGTVHIAYSSPSMKGRKIFGGLLPYGEVWRAGANEATTFALSKDVTVGNKVVPAGSYTLFTIPEKDKWTLIISKKTGEWGVPYPGADSDFTRLPMIVGTLPAPQEKMSIQLANAGPACTMTIAWETTKASIDVK